MIVDDPQPVKPKARTKRWVLASVAVIFLVGVACAGWWLFQRKQAADEASKSPSSSAISHVCGSSLIREANAPLANSDQVALSAVDTIKGLKNYTHDPNCLYIVLQYDLAAGDAAASRSDLDAYTRLYDPVVGLSDAFDVSIISVDELRQNVAFLEKNDKSQAADEQLNDKSTAAGSEAADNYHKEHQ
jgi:hypothetical protein